MRTAAERKRARSYLLRFELEGEGSSSLQVAAAAPMRSSASYVLLGEEEHVTSAARRFRMVALRLHPRLRQRVLLLPCGPLHSTGAAAEPKTAPACTVTRVHCCPVSCLTLLTLRLELKPAPACTVACTQDCASVLCCQRVLLPCVHCCQRALLPALKTAPA